MALPVQAQAGYLGDLYRMLFVGLTPEKPAAGDPRAGKVGAEAFEKYKPAEPPSEEAKGNRNEISDAMVASAVTVDRFNVCRVVRNTRGDIHNVMIPHLTEEEWASFVAHPPPGIVLEDCTCGRNLSPEEIYAVVGNVREIFAPQAPLPGVRPRMSSRATTINYICEQMGCGPPEWIATRTYSSPDNNAIVRWTGSAWQKVPATVENEKIDGCAATEEKILRCKPLGEPAGGLGRTNCD